MLQAIVLCSLNIDHTSRANYFRKMQLNFRSANPLKLSNTFVLFQYVLLIINWLFEVCFFLTLINFLKLNGKFML